MMAKLKPQSTKRIALCRPYGGWVPSSSRDDMGSKILELGFVTVEDGNRVRNPSDMEEFAPFHDFTLRAFARWEDYEHNARPFECTNWEAIYSNVYSVDMRDCERMLKMLRKVNSVRWPVTPQSFGQFAALICDALKVRTMVTALSGGSWHNETEHRIDDTKYLESSVDSLVLDFQYRVRPETRPEYWIDPLRREVAA